MRSAPSRADDLESEIVRAFNVVAYPGADRIVAGDSGEYVDAKRELGSSRWQDLPAAKIGKWDWVLAFLTPSGFQYYLPAYLLYTVKNVMNPSLACDSTIYSLCVGECFSERFREFSRSQRLAVKHFLEFVRDFYPDEYEQEQASQALDDYWRRSVKDDSDSGLRGNS